VGKVLGANWTSLRVHFHRADIVILAIIALAVALFIYRHVKPERKNSAVSS
jgi:membrane protein DedA with SNARE-associated domain